MSRPSPDLCAVAAVCSLHIDWPVVQAPDRKGRFFGRAENAVSSSLPATHPRARRAWCEVGQAVAHVGLRHSRTAIGLARNQHRPGDPRGFGRLRQHRHFSAVLRNGGTSRRLLIRDQDQPFQLVEPDVRLIRSIRIDRLLNVFKVAGPRSVSSMRYALPLARFIEHDPCRSGAVVPGILNPLSNAFGCIRLRGKIE